MKKLFTCLVILAGLLSAFSVKANDYYWVGGSGNWSAFATHWATTSGGSTFHTQVPQSIDNVFFDSNSFTASGQTVTLDITTAVCKDMNWTGVTNNPTFNFVNRTLKIYGSLTLVSGMTLTNLPVSAASFSFEATSTGKTVTTAGKAIGQVWFVGIGGGWTLQDALSAPDGIFLNGGSLNTNNQTITAFYFTSSNTTTRSLTLGSSVINLTWSSQSMTLTTDPSLTFSAGTSTINCVGAFQGGGRTFNNVNFVTTTNTTLNGNNTISNLTRSGSGTFTINNNSIITTASISGNTTFADNNTFGTLNLTGVGVTYLFGSGKTQTISTAMTVASGDCNSLTNIISSTTGAQATISKTSGAVTADYVNLKDMAATGGASFTANNAVNQGNNTGWTINVIAPRDLYWIGGSGNWSDGSHWSLTSGGPSLGCSPIATDNVFFDANSFTAAGQTVTLNVTTAACKDMNWTGVTNNPTFNFVNRTLKIYGSLTLVSGMTLTNLPVSAASFSFEATSTGKTVTTAGKAIGQVWFVGIGGGWTLQDALSAPDGIFLNGGSLNTNNQTITAFYFTSSNTTTRSLTLGSSVINLTWSSQSMTLTTDPSLTFSAGTSTINCVGAFQGGGRTFNNVNFVTTTNTTLNGNNTISNLTRSGSGTFTINNNSIITTASISGNTTFADNNTFGTLNLTGVGVTYLFGSGKTQTISTALNITGGSGGNPVFLSSNSAGTQATISMASGTVCTDYIRTTDIRAIGGASFVAGPSSQNISNTTGWTFVSGVPNPTVTITANTGTTTCLGNSVTFTAAFTNGGLSRTFEWFVNGVSKQNSSSDTYTSSTIPNGAAVYCVISAYPTTCSFVLVVNSNTLNMTMNNIYITPSVSIAASLTYLNPGVSATFTATPVNGGSTPAYQWKNNGINVGTNSAIYVNPVLTAADTITCVLTSNASCVSPATATSNSYAVSNNANLSSLSLSSGTLSPIFASGTVSYTAAVSNSTGSITVTPTSSDAASTIRVMVWNSVMSVSSGTPSGSIQLTVGDNVIKTEVTAQDGSTIKNYMVTVTRGAPAFPYNQSFMYSTAANMVYGGTPNTAALTAGGADAEGAGYLRLTNNTANQSGFARGTTAFPSANGLAASFEYYTHSGNGGDGFAFILFDATANPYVGGASGGALGYAQSTIGGGLPGVSKGYIAIGFDEAGNFSNPTAGRQGGPGQRSNSVTLRGDGDGSATIASNYEYLTGIQTSNGVAMAAAGAGSAFNIWGANGRSTISLARPRGGLTTTDNGYRKAKIELLPNGSGTGFKINVWITEGNGGGGIVHHVITDYQYVGSTLPPNLSFGFASSTGAYSNMHEIRNLDIIVPGGASLAPTVTNINKSSTQDVVVPFTASNFTSRFSDPANDPLVKIKVLSLPLNGILKLSGTAITINQEINLASLGAITFVPASGYTGTSSFQWNGSDGALYAASYGDVVMTLSPPGTNAFPYSESFKNSTASGMVFGGSPSASLTGGGIDANGAGYLRLNNNAPSQLGFARNTKEFPSADGFSVSFEYYSYGGSGADGLSFFLYDAAANGSFQIGAPGGSMGYAQNSVTPGLSKGYIGIGLDEFGSFSTATSGRMGGPGQKPSSVTIRGDGNGAGAGSPGGSNFEYLTNIQTSNAAAMTAAGAGSAFQIAGGVNGRTGGAGGLAGTSNGYRKARISFLPMDSLRRGYLINVWITEGNAAGPIEHHVVTDYNYISTNIVPANLSYGFSGATGGYTNYHEIRNLEITVPGGVNIPVIMSVDNSLAANNMLSVWSQTPSVGDKKEAAAINLPAATNILSPNRDGKNDTWVIRNLDKYPRNSVTIVDRNGKVVYRKANYRNDWDGTFRGAILPEDTYYYIIEFGKEINPLKGFISIVK